MRKHFQSGADAGGGGLFAERGWDNDATGVYQFQMTDLANATLLTLGVTVSSMLSPANETDLYQFTAIAGDQFSFDSSLFREPMDSLAACGLGRRHCVQCGVEQ